MQKQISTLRPLLHRHNNFVAIKMTVGVTIYTLQCVPSKTHQVFVLSHRRCSIACAWTPVKCLLIWYYFKVNKSALWLHCCFARSAPQFTCSTCKSSCATLFTLLIVLHNSVYYNYIIIMQWLVGWLIRESRYKGGLHQQKSALHVAPCHYNCLMWSFCNCTCGFEGWRVWDWRGLCR